MKKTIPFLLLPLAVACSGHQKAAPVKTSELSPKEPSRILGVVSYDEHCKIDKKVTACLKVKGGGDLNDTRTFVINDSVNGFEVVDEKANPRTFRMWTKDRAKPIEVFEHEHVSIVADSVTEDTEMQPRIGGIQSVAKLEK